MPEDEEFTELLDADFPRVDLVGKAANGIPRFLVAKGANGAFEAGFVRELVEKAVLSGKELNDLPDSDFAYIEPGGKKDDEGKTVPRSLRHFAVQDAAHVRNALSRAPQSPFGDKAMPKIRAAADKFGVDVAKAASDDLTALSGEPNFDDAPGSQGWEQLDADTALAWAGILSRAKNAVELLAGREAQEVFFGADGADGDDVFDLEDASCAIQSAIDVLAPFAAGEQAESDLVGEISKAAWVLKNGTVIDTIEELGSVVKAGRTLSAQNEARIREAVGSLQTVLSTLPDPAEKVTKEGAMTTNPDSVSLPHGDDENNKSSGDANPVVVPSDVETLSGLSDDVAKASGDPMMAVYNASGKLLGAVDPSKITELTEGGDSEPEPEPEPEAPPEDLAPAPSGTVGMEPVEVSKSTDDVIKAAIGQAVKEVSDAKDAEYASVIKSFEDRLAALEEPAPSRVLANGALPPTHMLRGMDEGNGAVDVAKAAELRARLEAAKDTVEREAVAKEMNANAVRAWQQMRDARHH